MSVLANASSTVRNDVAEAQLKTAMWYHKGEAMALPADKETPKYTNNDMKLMGISSRLQTIMLNENLTPGELVGCAESVRDGYQALKREGMTAVDGELRCSFCNVPRAEANKIIVGAGNVCICDRCVELCVGILKPDTEAK